MGEFRMPSLGADMDAGTITTWLVQPGDTVHRGDVVAVVETDKADVEVEVFENGVVSEILVPEGRKVAVGTPLATLVAEGAAEPVPTVTGGPAAEPVASPVVRRLARDLGVDVATVGGTGPEGVVTRHDVEAAVHWEAPGAPPTKPAKQKPAKKRSRPRKKPAPEPERPRASPRARRRAQELGVDITAVEGSGRGGTITVADVEAAAAPGPKSAPRAVEKGDLMRQAIGALMARSKREIPHYYLGTHVDVTDALAWLETENAQRAVAERILPAALFLKATALAARDVPELNGFWIDDAFQPGAGVHLGVAVSQREGGLVAPALHDADTKDLPTLMADLRDLVARVRAGRLRASEMSDPTLTVSNLGDQGVETVYGVIYPPQVALVGFGRVIEQPWADAGLLGVRRVVHVTLSADHRATDGHIGARFLAAVARHLEEPEQL